MNIELGLRSPVVVLWLASVASLAGACSRTAECLTLEGACANAETGTDDGEGSTGGNPTDDPALPVNKDVDVLFVIDNSGSMGEEQAILAANIGSFIDVLEADGVEANYRIGVTTTDNGNPWCPAGTTTPEGGQLVLTPCTARLGDFLFSNDVDVQDLACNDICSLDPAALEILPTTTDLDAQPKSRPWLERIEGKKNIPDSTSTADAFACFGPQGVNGCGFESQLESMYLALLRAQTEGEASYGFMRSSAILAVVFVTDEADCSYNKDWASIFDAEGNKVFWSDPQAPAPTSAVCWNAGVECLGDPSAYDLCEAVNKDADGNITDDESAAVLHPMSRYIDQLRTIELQKQQLNPALEVIVALIGGVDQTGVPFYADVGDSDPEFQTNFGIGPGCTAPNPLDPNNPVSAVPPVRLRDLTEEFTPNNMFSICEADYSPALDAVAKAIADQIKPACFSKCVADQDPETPVVEAECTVEQDPPGADNTTEVAECLRDADGYVIDANDDYTMPDAATNVCYVMLVDKDGLTSDPHDDMSQQCVDANFNLEFKIIRRVGFPAAGGTSMSAECELAEQPELSCPGIGG